MKSKNPKRPSRVKGCFGVQYLFCLTAFVSVVQAQQVITQPPQYSVPPPALQNAGNEMQVFNPEQRFLTMLENINPYQWGPVSFRPSVSYQFLYGNGIQSSPGQQQSSIVQTFSPNFLFILGTHWTLSYTPSWKFYSSSAFQNTLDHAITLSGGTAYNDWILSFSQSYTRSDDPEVETATQTKQENYSTILSATYELNSKISLNAGINQDLSYADQLNNSRQWSGDVGFAYHFWSRFNLGASVSGGYDSVDVGPNMTFEQVQGTLGWRATDKISFQINGGLEDRQFLISGASDLISPIFGASIQYQPLQLTTVSLSANRSVSPSLFDEEITENTDVSLTLNQRLLKRLNLSLSGGYNTVDYLSSVSGLSANRTDNYYSFNARLGTTILKRITAAVFYTYSSNSSTQSGFAYSSNQEGFTLGYQF